MKKIFGLALMSSVLIFGLAMNAQAGPMIHHGLSEYDATKLVWVMVKSRDGVDLGRVLDLVIDSQGHANFAVVVQPGVEEYPGRAIVVPFPLLQVSQDKSGDVHIVLNADKEKFYLAPGLGTSHLASRQWVARDYRYFGLRPYWTESEVNCPY